MFAVAMLMADDGLDFRGVKHLFDFQSLGAGQRDGFLEGDQFRAAIDAGLDQVRAQIGSVQKQKMSGLTAARQRARRRC